MISKKIAQIKKRKIIAGIALLLIAGVSYWSFGKIFSDDGAIRYASAQAQKGTLIVSISGSGQVSASNQLDIKPKVSGDIVYVGVKNGQEVKAGTLIAQLDARDTQKTVRDAEVSLENAKLALDKLKLGQQQQLRGDTLNKAHEEGMETLSSFYREFGAILNSVEDIFFGNDLSDNMDNISYYVDYLLPYDQKSPIPNSAKSLFSEVEKLRQQALVDFQIAERGSGDARSQAIKSGYKLVIKTAQLIKLGEDAVKLVYDHLVFFDSSVYIKWDIIESQYDDLATHASSIDVYIQKLLTVQNAVNNQRDALQNQPFDLRLQEITIKQRENALLDAKEKLADYYVRAPFDGVIAKMDAKKGDSVSSSNALATLITRQKLAEIPLNEVDVVQVKVGQKVTLTFDAVPELTITGQVAEMDVIGTASQGVVTYNVKIAFDTQDERVKPSMSVSASIITEVKSNVLLVPNSAVKSQGGMSYVEMVEGDDRNTALATNVSGAILANFPRQQPVEIGTANDEFTEIVSGLNAGDIVVTRTIQPAAAQTTQTQQQNSSLRIPGLNTGGTGGFRTR